MTPRHLWSGDWRRESAAAAEDLAARRVRRSTRAEDSPPPPPRPSAAARTLGRLRDLRAHPGRGAALTAVAMLLSAAAGYAIASSLISSGDKQAPKAALPSSRPPHQAAGGSVARAWLGADTSDLPGVGGVVVVDVVPGSPADSAGLEPGDVITQIDGRPIRTSADVQAVLAGMKAGEAVEIQYQRGPISATAQATLTARPPNVP